jgi:type IV pilus assembly protein PilM
MLARLLPAGKTRVGLDIGSYTIKVVELREARREASLVNYGLKEIPPEARGERKALGTLIRELLDERGIKGDRATVAIGGFQAVIRRLTIPPMPAKEIKGAARWEGKEQIPFPIAQAVTGFQLLGQIEEEGTKKFEVVAAFAHEELVMGRISLIERAGLKPERVTLIPVALWSCFRRNYQGMEGEVIALVEIGASATTVCLLKGGDLCSTREIPLGGAAVTQAVMEALASERGSADAALEEAEMVKRRYGVLLDTEEKRPEDDLPLRMISVNVIPSGIDPRSSSRIRARLWSRPTGGRRAFSSMSLCLSSFSS